MYMNLKSMSGVGFDAILPEETLERPRNKLTLCK